MSTSAMSTLPALLILELCVAYGIYVCCTPPQASPPKEQRKSSDFPVVVHASAAIYEFSCWAHVAIEIFILISSVLITHFPESGFASLANNPLLDSFIRGEHKQTIAFPPLRILGGLFVIAGGCIRYLCYRELGRLFTFHVAILEKHALIKSGPYSIVRHPSYVGGCLHYTGSILWYGTPGAWAWETHFYETKIAWLVLVPSALMIACFFVVVIARPKKEDEMLKQEFGKEWDDWAKAVPYRLIPGIY